MNKKFAIRHLVKAIGLIVLVVIVLFSGREIMVDIEYNYPNYTNRQYVYGSLEGPILGDSAVFKLEKSRP